MAEEPIELLVDNVEGMADAAKAIGLHFADRRIFLLRGEMGSGKTTFVKAFCQWLGVEETVSSPTFSLVNEYGQASKIYHFDLYRLETEQALLDIGFEEYVDQTDSYIFIEWPELAIPYLPKEVVEVEIKANEEGIRELLAYVRNYL